MFSQIQQTFLLFAALGSLDVVDAHGRVRQWTITKASGETQVKMGQDYNILVPTENTAQRLKDNANNDDPLYLEAAGDLLACNSAATSATDTWLVEPGDIVTPYWSHQGGIGGPPAVGGFWPSGHSGPAINYMAACPSSGCNGFLASTADWFKISEAITYEGQWVTEKIFKDGQWPITMPSDLKPGDYLLRHEIMSVHGLEGTPQIYPACIQIKLGGSGTVVPEKTYKILDAYENFNSTFMHYQPKTAAGLLSPEKPFFTPGPPVYDGSGGGADGGIGYSGTAAVNATLSDSNAVAASISSSLAAAGYTDTNYVPNPNAATSTAAQSGASSVVGSQASTAVGTSIQAGASSAPGSSAPATTSLPAGPTSPGGPANPSMSPPVGSGSPGAPKPGESNAYTGPPPVSGAYTAAPTGNIMGEFVNKAVVNASDGTGSSLEKPFPSSSDGATAGADSVAPTFPTALAAGADSSAASVVSGAATSSAATGTSEYVSNVQGGSCQTNTWRCQKKADGTAFLEVCEPKAVGYDWGLSNPLCPSKCDDSKPQNPVCE